MNKQLQFRQAGRQDVPLILRFIRELAAYEKISCDYSGDGLTIGFKSSHILDMLGNMESSTIVMKFADERRAVLIVPSEEEEESGKICGIMMPIMIS